MKPSKNSRGSAIKVDGAEALARLLEIPGKDAAAIQVRVALLKKIIAEVARQKLTHAQAAELAGTSRSRMTCILNGAIQNVSTDLLLRVLSALGFRARVIFEKAA